VLTQVAVRGGGQLRDVAEEAYAVTLWTFLELEDAARITRFVTRSERLDLAGLMAMATHAPKELSRVHRELLREARGDRDAIRDKETRLIERLRTQFRPRRPRPALPPAPPHG
jgi:hypothetical protein